MTKIAEAWLELTRIIAKESGTYKADVPGVADWIEGAIRALALAVLEHSLNTWDGTSVGLAALREEINKLGEKAND